ncbi:MAG: hypothetical protein AAF581_10980 [Planctomycetota bacterium]
MSVAEAGQAPPADTQVPIDYYEMAKDTLGSVIAQVLLQRTGAGTRIALQSLPSLTHKLEDCSQPMDREELIDYQTLVTSLSYLFDQNQLHQVAANARAALSYL